MEVISEIYPIEFMDMIGHEYEISSSSEEIQEDQSQIIHFSISHIRPRNKPRLGNKIKMNPIIKDFIINEEEYAIENERGKRVKATGNWAFKLAYEFFEEKNQQNKD